MIQAGGCACSLWPTSVKQKSKSIHKTCPPMTLKAFGPLRTAAGTLASARVLECPKKVLGVWLSRRRVPLGQTPAASFLRMDAAFPPNKINDLLGRFVSLFLLAKGFQREL